MRKSRDGDYIYQRYKPHLPPGFVHVRGPAIDRMLERAMKKIKAVGHMSKPAPCCPDFAEALKESIDQTWGTSCKVSS